MMVIFLIGLVVIILMRTLKRDFAAFAQRKNLLKLEVDLEDLINDDDVADESGWKQIRGDVLRTPPHLELLSALLGTGFQLAILVISVLCLAIVGTYYTRRGTVVTAFIVCYSFTSFISGYVSSSFYSKHGGASWIVTMFMTAGIFPGIAALISFVLNFVALSYDSLSYIPFSTMVAVVAIWTFIALPLTFIGTIVGKNMASGRDSKKGFHVPAVPRQIPEKKWWAMPITHVLLGGILPFGSIFIEMYFVFTSFYKYYYVYGITLLVLFILILVVVCVTIVSTYFLLNSEDYRWQWTSWGAGASTALYLSLIHI
eukprot:TRINITY_DN3821_c0_g1_i1.p1 TRINITY_DN3821_c0_g1~~TRINITY_DN3821_c0_g1_i1.p1  ORF type:complete len:314 (-),score=42.52 TRINITY_DN3821_c0_g1_i1:23-964(-)